MFTRKLGKSGIEVSALGLGCWAIGGPWTFDRGEGEPYKAGWGRVDDRESIRAIHAGLDLGINFFDTAANYGAGHSERILARALKGRRDKVIIATKFGYIVDEGRKFVIRDDHAVLENIPRDCEESLRRLDCDYIDLYQFHVGDYDVQMAADVSAALEKLVSDGKIRWYGWSTDNTERAHIFAPEVHCTAIQQAMNWASEHDYEAILKICEQFNLASINRSPLGMGLLTGKFQGAHTKLPEDDIRHRWDFKAGKIPETINQVETLREILTRDGRTLAQGALGWLWARSEFTIPIPGFKMVSQVKENAGALAFGPLAAEQMVEIDRLLGRQGEE